MKEDSMIYFENTTKFLMFYRDLNIYNEWKISNGYMNDRGKLIYNKLYTETLRKLFIEKNMFHKRPSIAEIVSWLDTLLHLYRIVKCLKRKLGTCEINSMEIYFEYIIQMSKLSRVDVIFKYKRKICLFEFSTVDKFSKMKLTYQKKRIELMIYKDLMKNYFPDDIKIIVFPFIGLYEYEGKKRCLNYQDSNLKQAEFASDYIIKFLIKNDYSPFD